MRCALASLFVVFFVTVFSGCGAVFPRYTTAYHPVPSTLADPGRLTRPTDAIQRITVREAEVAPHRQDGSNWDPDGPPDLYVVIQRDGHEVYRTPVIHDGLHPVWTNASVTLRVTPETHLLIELWDDDGPFDDIVGRQEFLGIPQEAMGGGEWLVALQGGASLLMSAGPPDPQLGIGVTYAVHDAYLGVLEVEVEGPAARAGLRAGDHITAIQGHAVSDLGESGAREAMDRGATSVMDLTVARGSEAPMQVRTRVDAVYPAR